ncbi:hypothetical protein [Polaromonas sp. UC242_47]|uniref:hypothetical protein n=1 Tax=Polaromonas sp. UC242_47 TaxID=3374626 RepID=UPI00379DAC53
MTQFTKIFVGFFIFLLLVASAVMALKGAFEAAVFWLAIALFFLITSRMAIFESRYGTAKSEPGMPRVGLKTQLTRYWKALGWEGKLFLAFFVIVISVWFAQRVLVFIQTFAR